MIKDSKKLQVKDLVTIGIFTAVYFVLNVIVMVCGGFAPPVWIFMPAILSIICGVVYSPLTAKVQKGGAVFIMGMITALIYSVRGSFVLVLLVTYLVSSLLAEAVRKKTGYNSIKGNIISYAFFSLGMTGDVLPVWMFREESTAQMVSKDMPQDYIDALNAFTSPAVLIIMLAATFILAFAGGYLGRAIMKKHLEKAGMVS